MLFLLVFIISLLRQPKIALTLLRIHNTAQDQLVIDKIMKLSSSFSSWHGDVQGFLSRSVGFTPCSHWCGSVSYRMPAMLQEVSVRLPFFHYKCKITWLNFMPFLKPPPLSQYWNMGYLGCDDMGSWLCCRHHKTWCPPSMSKLACCQDPRQK